MTFVGCSNTLHLVPIHEQARVSAVFIPWFDHAVPRCTNSTPSAGAPIDGIAFSIRMEYLESEAQVRERPHDLAYENVHQLALLRNG